MNLVHESWVVQGHVDSSLQQCINQIFVVEGNTSGGSRIDEARYRETWIFDWQCQ